MPRLLDSVRVVDEGDGYTIDEFIGGVATTDDSMSVAHVIIRSPTAYPWLTLHCDEQINVLKGQVDVHYMDGDEEKVFSVKGGQACQITKGERFRPVFPVSDTEYVPVCRPAFTPDRCIREEEGESPVTTKLKKLHNNNNPNTEDSSNGTAAKNNAYDSIDILYHMCDKQKWENAVTSGEAYYPPTFEADGNFIHATAVPARLLEVGNHFYKDVKGDWICLELSRSVLAKKCGIITIFEEAKAVGTTATADDWKEMLFPHIFGGIPTCVDGIITKTFPIKRGEDGSFQNIVGLTDQS